ncbi:hypothetical protein [Rhodococcus sp. P1Y]|uniref:hypothetical protein n=1 Tax=Rhodococcus sp. P1Y TaxID=1302308 RepID=UPI000EB4F0AE|nr:hypothetical protein [Rhodococcus sp. P1Y]AYJ48109.1 hypothetical protein D8W71_06910 [Rhodococcus sp. P1Y]
MPQSLVRRLPFYFVGAAILTITAMFLVISANGSRDTVIMLVAFAFVLAALAAVRIYIDGTRVQVEERQCLQNRGLDHGFCSDECLDEWREWEAIK